MKNLSESVVEEFASHQALVAQDESVDYTPISGEEFFTREQDIFDECVPPEVRRYEAVVESIPLKFAKSCYL